MKSISINNPDNSTNQIQVFGRENREKPVILILPAMAIKSKYYKAFAEELSKKYIVATGDLRGHGHSNIRPSVSVDFGYKEMIEQDLHSMVNALKTMFPRNSLYLMGHSLGGQMACLYTAREMNFIDGLILIGCCSVYYRGWSGLERFKTLAGTQFIGAIGKAIGYYPGKTFGFGGLESKTVVTDWSNQSRTGKYVLMNDPTDYEHALGKMKIDTLAISFEADTLSPEKAVENLYLKFNPTSDIEHLHLKNNHPLNDHFDHYTWTKKPANVASIIANWLEKR